MAEHPILLILLLVGGPMFLVTGLRTWQKKRLMENTPCSKVRSAAMGRVEITGVARPARPMQALLTQKPCCWWRYRVQEYRKQGKSKNWVTLATFESPEPFYIEDETGRVLVDPTQAEIYLPHTIYPYKELPQPHAQEQLIARGVSVNSWFGFDKKIRVIENRIDELWPVYVFGELAQRINFLAGRKERLNDLLRKAKSNPTLMAQADTNRDGHLDAAEWDALRAQLESEFLERESEAQRSVPPDQNLVIRHPVEGPFIVAGGDEASLIQSFGWWAPLSVLGGIGMTTGGIFAMPDFRYSFLIIFGMIAAGLLIGSLGKSKGVTSWVFSR